MLRFRTMSRADIARYVEHKTIAGRVRYDAGVVHGFETVTTRRQAKNGFVRAGMWRQMGGAATLNSRFVRLVGWVRGNAC